MKTIYKKLFIFLLFLPFSVLAQGTLKGTVTDKASGQSLPGVNVVVQGTTNGTSTDFDGNYTLNNVKRGDQIVFSYIGFRDVVISYDAQTSLSVSMEEDANQLQEVVVQVGYGSVKKKDLTGAVTTVTTKDFNKGANVTTENLLNGRVAGLTINTSGAPGSGSEIRIRGGASLFASNDPLIVIDGLPIENNNIAGSTSFLASLNPSTIESVTVLKDASATAIYGSRASNGVIIITTKSGGKKLTAEYNFQYGSGRHTNTVDVLGANQFRQAIFDNYPIDTPDDNVNATNQGVRDLLGTANTNWQDAIYRRTDYVDNNLSVRGSLFNAIPARLTIGNTYQEGLRLTNSFTRNTAGVSLNPSMFKDHLKMRINANYAYQRNRFADGVEGTAIRFDPTQPIYDANSPYGGFFEYYNTVTTGGVTTYPLLLAPRNPVAQLLQTYDRGNSSRLFGNVEFDYKLHFFPDMRAVVNLGYDESNGERLRDVAPNVVASGPANGNDLYGTNEYTEEVRTNKLLDAYLIYNKTIGKTDIEAQGGYSYQRFEYWQKMTGNTNNPDLPANFPETYWDPEVVLIGFFGRVKFDFSEKYLLTLNYRRDGSSRFGKDNRWGNFPAAAFAWRASEQFFKDSKTVSDLKLRLGYGITGQQEISDKTLTLQKFITGSGTSQYYFGESAVPIAVPDRTNPDLKWEETTTYNVGLDLGFWDNRLSMTFDAFYKKSEDLLIDGPVPDGSNFSNRIVLNNGSFTTKGFEATLNAQIVKSGNFSWNVNFNATTFEREVTELLNHDDIFVGGNIGGTGTPGQIFREGYSPYSFFVYKQLYDADGAPIEGAYADLNGDGITNDDDRYIRGNPDPDLTLGFASTLNFWNFDFSFNMRANLGGNVYNGVAASQAQLDLLKTDQALNNVPTSVNATNFNTTSNVLLSDIYIEDASFLRMDNITLGYTFGKWLDGKASVRVSAGVQNAFIITDYEGLDPEITNNGLDKTIYPRQRQWLFGVNMKF